MSEPARTFHWADYLVFASILVISGIIGCVAGRGQDSAEDFTLAGRGMGLLPVALSIVGSLAAVYVLGIPAEMYLDGVQQWHIFILPLFVAVFVTALLFVPLFYPLKIASIYEYLELRYKSKVPKITSTLLFILALIMNMGVSLFTPSTALESVTGFPTWASILACSGIAIFYTTTGGLKAVIWTDAFQALFTMAGLLAVAIQGTIAVGGFAEVFEISDRGGRLNFFVMDPDPSTRVTFWGCFIGGIFGWLGYYGINQPTYQRYASLPNQRKAKLSVFLNIPGIALLMTVTCYCGLVIYAYYDKKGCDPVMNGELANPNQIAPYFVMEVLNYPGIPGLFVATLFSGTLSTCAASLAGISSVVWEDLLKWKYGHISNTKQVWVNRGLVLIFGILGTGFAVLVTFLEGTVLQFAFSFTGAITGPVLGMYLLGAIFPCATGIGASVGAFVALGVLIWINVGQYSLNTNLSFKPTRIDMCPVANITTNMTELLTTTQMMTTQNITTPMMEPEYNPLEKWYGLSYLWYPMLGTAVTMVVGLLFSCVAGVQRTENVEPRYMMPVANICCCCLPKSTQDCLQCGMDHDEEAMDADVLDEKRVSTISGGDYVNGGMDNMGMEMDKTKL
ncbi:unnamed protein product [Owenia fusiformis]|uniref:Uncharacterized protein n=1 Tax=Owenia fusiformis TaxID=6347 RepID=A0A8J1UB97_OWEFU|nr:unnamed protein product [Owenia fusiformis]